MCLSLESASKWGPVKVWYMDFSSQYPQGFVCKIIFMFHSVRTSNISFAEAEEEHWWQPHYFKMPCLQVLWRKLNRAGLCCCLCSICPSLGLATPTPYFYINSNEYTEKAARLASRQNFKVRLQLTLMTLSNTKQGYVNYTQHTALTSLVVSKLCYRPLKIKFYL